MKIKDNINLNTQKQLLLLLVVFIAGFVLLISMHFVFNILISHLDEKTTNLKTKIQIGEFIAEDIHKIRSDFFEIATSASNKRGRELIKTRLTERVDNIKKMLDVIDNGGTFQRTIRLNVANHNDTVKTIVYLKETSSNSVSFESIDVRPKLDELVIMSDELMLLLTQKDELIKSKKSIELIEQAKEISRFYKSAPAYFVRMTENIRRLLYEGDLELQKIQEEIDAKKDFYSLLELLIIIIIISIVLILGYVISKQISQNNKTLKILNSELQNNIETLRVAELSTRSILNAQPNIVIVGDGIEMKDANSALFDFFDKYQTLSEFKKEHKCVCDFFLDIGDDYVFSKNYDGQNWAVYVLNNPQITHKVAMFKGDILHHFSLNVEKQILNEQGEFIIVVTLSDITHEININKQLKDLNNNLESLVTEKTKELQQLNEELEDRIILEVEKNRQKERQIMQQSRSAALGEMIANIAHQWRQPLSAISSTSSSIQLQMSLGITTEDEIQKALNNIMRYVAFLTQTIEDFRGYFKEDKEKVNFNINETIDKTLAIIGPSYKDTGIEIIKDYEMNFITSYGFPNELSQVFLNVLNNAKDATISKRVDNKFVLIKTCVEDWHNVVYIQDNAGGIPENIMTKIFDPYFTTKHQSQGTGIGLYMSKDIVEKHMSGFITCENRLDYFNGVEFNGACFRIAIPQNSCSLENIG